MFGMLKGHFRLLKTGIRLLHSVSTTDRMWLTCCALHNFLLEADGLHEQWQSGVPSDYETSLGQSRRDELEGDIPPHLNHPNLDLTEMGIGTDVRNAAYSHTVEDEAVEVAEHSTNGTIHSCQDRRFSAPFHRLHAFFFA